MLTEWKLVHQVAAFRGAREVSNENVCLSEDRVVVALRFIPVRHLQHNLCGESVGVASQQRMPE